MISLLPPFINVDLAVAPQLAVLCEHYYAERIYLYVDLRNRRKELKAVFR